ISPELSELSPKQLKILKIIHYQSKSINVFIDNYENIRKIINEHKNRQKTTAAMAGEYEILAAASAAFRKTDFPSYGHRRHRSSSNIDAIENSEYLQPPPAIPQPLLLKPRRLGQSKDHEYRCNNTYIYSQKSDDRILVSGVGGVGALKPAAQILDHITGGGDQAIIESFDTLNDSSCNLEKKTCPVVCDSSGGEFGDVKSLENNDSKKMKECNSSKMNRNCGFCRVGNCDSNITLDRRGVPAKLDIWTNSGKNQLRSIASGSKSSNISTINHNSNSSSSSNNGDNGLNTNIMKDLIKEISVLTNIDCYLLDDVPEKVTDTTTTNFVKKLLAPQATSSRNTSVNDPPSAPKPFQNNLGKRLSVNESANSSLNNIGGLEGSNSKVFKADKAD
ncbi:hypothetical protein HK100_011652, partial [Physocladia obscura]